MPKIMQISTYDETTSTWRAPIDIGAKAENVVLNNNKDIESVIGNYTDSVSVADKLEDISTAINDHAGRLTTYKDITVSTTAENYTYQGITYTRKHAISWSGATTADIFDGVIISGTYTDDWGIENDTAGVVNLRFASTPSGTLKIRVFRTKGVAG